MRTVNHRPQICTPGPKSKYVYPNFITHYTLHTGKKSPKPSDK
jgi:hypothetical protein